MLLALNALFIPNLEVPVALEKKEYRPEMLITRIPYLIGTVIVALIVAYEIAAMPKLGTTVALVMAAAPIWAFLALVLGIGPIGMAFPSNMTLPNFLVFPTLFMTWPLGLASLVLYGTVAYPVLAPIPIWVLVPAGILLAAISGIALGNIIEYSEITASKWNIKNWINWRWSWAGIALTALTLVEGFAIGLVVRHTPTLVCPVLTFTTAVKLLACFAAPWRYRAPQSATY